ncbi:hypothetical protein N9N67_01615 [Bacteriovoracaceae bacterium]|nr:hypothetical protein [Bacteriovoracaceae bacterium]
MKASFKFAMALVLMSFTTLSNATTAQQCVLRICKLNQTNALSQQQALGQTIDITTKHRSPFSKFMGKVGSGIGNFFKNDLPSFFSIVGKGIKTGWKGAGKGLSTAWNWVAKPFRPTYTTETIAIQPSKISPAIADHTLSKAEFYNDQNGAPIPEFQAVNI